MTRRNLLKFAGGSAVGILFTPAPWRLITDAALWSENWPGIPKPARGEVSFKFSNCSMCTAGCAVKARCIGRQPVSLTGVAKHPLSRGALCPFGLAGHHLPYHPERVLEGPAQDAAAAVKRGIAEKAPEERIAVLDLRPGRTASWTYRRAMAAVDGGMYLAGPQKLGGAAVNLASAKTVLSFGAPLLEGWGTPGNVVAHRPSFRLIQVEPVESRTAVLADQWLRIAPGSENALALGLANALLSAGGANAGKFPEEAGKRAAAYTLARTAAETGLPEQQIAQLAKDIAANGPTLAVSRSYSPDVHALNLLAGAWGTALTARRDAPVPESWQASAPVTEIASAPDGSLKVLLIDESEPEDLIPWGEIERKLARNAIVVVFSASRNGFARHARFTLPVAVFPELTSDVPPAVDSPATAFRLSSPLVKAPGGVVDPAQFIAEGAGISAANALRERADAIQKSGRGVVFSPAESKSTPMKELKPDDFWKALQEGGCWISEDTLVPPPEPRWSSVAGKPSVANLPLSVAFMESGIAPGLGSPILSKLYRESGLLLEKNHGLLHPETARVCGMAEGGAATLNGAFGKCSVQISVDESATRGVLQLAWGPEVLDVCGAESRAKVTRI